MIKPEEIKRYKVLRAFSDTKYAVSLPVDAEIMGVPTSGGVAFGARGLITEMGNNPLIPHAFVKEITEEKEKTVVQPTPVVEKKKPVISKHELFMVLVIALAVFIIFKL